MTTPAASTSALTHTHYSNAAALLSHHFHNSLPHIPKIDHRFPSTRFPDQHTRIVAFALCDFDEWPLPERESQNYFPYLKVTLYLDPSFRPHQDLPFRANAPISETVNELLYFSSKKLEALMRRPTVYARAGGENALQGLLFAEEGVILSELFSLDAGGNSLFFNDLPALLKTSGETGLYHGMTKNQLQEPYRIWLSAEALKNRSHQLSGRSEAEIAQDKLLKTFAKKVPSSGSIPDHLFGLLKDSGVAIVLVEEKRLYPGALLDVLRMTAHYGGLHVFMGGENMPQKMASQEQSLWVGSPEAGHWYSRIFWQVFAECNAMDCGYFLITDRYHTILGRCTPSGVSILLLHFFTHCTIENDIIESPLAEFERTGRKPPGVASDSVIPAVDPSSPQAGLHTRMGLLEAFTRVIYFAAQNRCNGPGHSGGSVVPSQHASSFL